MPEKENKKITKVAGGLGQGGESLTLGWGEARGRGL